MLLGKFKTRLEKTTGMAQIKAWFREKNSLNFK